MSIQAALDKTTKAASVRAAEGQRLFRPIATFLNKHCSESTDLLPRPRRALASLRDELSAVVQ
jgi:hypothetical protein